MKRNDLSHAIVNASLALASATGEYFIAIENDKRAHSMAAKSRWEPQKGALSDLAQKATAERYARRAHVERCESTLRELACMILEIGGDE